MKKQTFDAVAFMRKRREELSRTYAGLSAEQIKERMCQTLKNNPLWKQPPDEQAPSRSRKKPGGCQLVSAMICLGFLVFFMPALVA